jgi:hypothetical protein
VYDGAASDIQMAAAADAQRVQKAFAAMARQGNGIFRSKVVRASDCTKKCFQAWLKTIRSSPTEGAVFYYAGRGSNVNHQKWPCIEIARHKRLLEAAVAKLMASRKPGLAMILFDCYARAITQADGIDLTRLTGIGVASHGGGPQFKFVSKGNRRVILGCSGRDVKRTLCSLEAQPVGGIFTTLFLKGWTLKSG